jgi:general nucleoside transport system permease protein
LAASAGALRSLVVPLAAAIAAVFVGVFVMALTGLDPWEGLQALAWGAFGSEARLGVTLTKATPLILAGLAVALPFRSGLLNIGGEGQLYIGALFATLAALGFNGLPAVIHLPLVVIAGFTGGALWGAIPGWLRAKLKLNELITTIMLNYVAFWVISYLVHGPMKDPNGGGYPWSVEIPESSILPIIATGLRINLGLVLALAAAALAAFVLWRTCFGFEMRAVGSGPLAARLAGINIERTVVLTLALGGGLAGLAGMAEIMGVQYRLSDFFSPGYGFDGVVVALVGQSNPVGVVIAALFFGAVRNGAESASRSIGVPASIALIIQTLTLLFVVGSNSPVLARAWLRRRQKRAADARPAVPIH